MRKPKLLVIGIDGATFDLIKPWCQEGKLPNLARLLAKGTHGELESVPNMNSAVAWASFMTGKNPGKHGVFYYTDREPNNYNLRYLKGSDIDGKSIWTILSEAGLRVGVINVPMTYPATPVNGIIIAGIDTPNENSKGFIYPPELQPVLLKEIDSYKIESNIKSIVYAGNPDLAVKRIYDTVRSRGEMAKYLMNRESFDFFMVCFTSTDRVQHYFWKDFDVSHPDYDKNESQKYGNAIFNVYRLVDQQIGDILRLADKNTLALVMSDHGFGPHQRGEWYLSQMLQAAGLLHFKSDSQKSLGFAKKILTIACKYSTLEMRRLLLRIPVIRNKILGHFRTLPIDWLKSKAYAYSMRSEIFINLKGRDPKGIVEPGSEYEHLRNYIIEKLYKCRDVKTGKKIVDKVFKREEVYSGKHLDFAPDLLIKWNSNLVASGLLCEDENGEVVQYLEPIVVETAGYSGHHREKGILIGSGGVVKPELINDARIIDLAPTILWLMGLPVPNDMDGRVLTEIFVDDFVKYNPIKYVDVSESSESQTEPKEYSEQDAKKIEERLKNLGYL